MADNLDVTPGSGRTVATDEIAGIHHQKVKVEFGGNDVATQVEDTPTGRLPVGGGAIGLTNETAPASDTAAAGLNGRMQRVAIHLSSLLALLPAAIGQQARGASLSVGFSDEDAQNMADILTALGNLYTAFTTPTTALPPYVRQDTPDLTYKDVAMTASGNLLILAGASGKKVLAHDILLTISGATYLEFYDGDPASGGTHIVGFRAPSTGMVLDRYNNIWSVLAAATSAAGLYIKSSGNVNIDGHIGARLSA